MKRVVTRGCLAVALLALLAVPASAKLATPTYRCVVVVLAPYLQWDDVTPQSAPTLAALIDDSAIANVTVRAGDPDPAPDGLHGAFVLSAGAPTVTPSLDAGLPDGPWGLLGGAVRGRGGHTVAVGTSATRPDAALERAGAQATVVAMDQSGTIDTSETSARVLVEAQDGPVRYLTDWDYLEAAYRRALAWHAADGPLLVVVDPGDAERARVVGGRAGAAWDSVRPVAVTAIDTTVRIALRSLPPDAALVVVSTAQYAGEDAAGFGPLIVYGAGPGLLDSAATTREGLMTLPDVSATVLAMLGIDAPAAMTGTVPERTSTSEAGSARLAVVRGADVVARALEAPRERVWFGFIGACLVVLGVAFFVLLRDKAPGRAVSAVLRFAVPMLAGVPLGTVVAIALGPPASADGAWGRIAVGVGAVAAATAWMVHRRGGPRALGAVTAATGLLLATDQLVGGPLAEGGAFSYSLVYGARFYGLGNEGAAILVGSILVAVGLRVDRLGVSHARDFLIALVPAVVIAVAPILGANIGVAIWGSAAAAVAFMYASGRRLTWRGLALGAAIALGMLGMAVAAEALLSETSHLGRFIGDVASGGLGAAASLLARKVALNVAILRTTPFVLVLPVALGGIGYLLAKRTGPLGPVVEHCRGLAAALAGCVAAAVLGALTEDSGVAISALVVLYAASALASVALARRDEEDAA